MITSYQRPKSLKQAMKILAVQDSRPLGGGTFLSHLREETFSVVDLQSLGLNKLTVKGNSLEVGATCSLQTMIESPVTPDALVTALRLEAPLNIRNMATVAGSLVTCDGRSPMSAVFLALDAKIYILDTRNVIQETLLSDFILSPREFLHGQLILIIEIPVNVKIAFEYVARTPMDKPIVSTTIAQWPSGRTRVVIGGWGNTPTLAMDGNDASGIAFAIENAARDANDEWASANYRSSISVILATRCLAQLAEK